MISVRREIIGCATVYLADCREIIPEIGRVDAVVTDPPYGIASGGVVDRPTKWQRRAGKETEKWDSGTIEELPEILARGTTQVVWGGNYYALPPSRGWLVWFKPDAPPTMASAELAWTNLDRNTRQIACSIGATNAERVGHPTQKPLAVMRWTLRQIATEPSLILDPFMGSGTTGVACIQFGWDFIGIEVEPRYFEMACQRLAQAEKQPDLFVRQHSRARQEALL